MPNSSRHRALCSLSPLFATLALFALGSFTAAQDGVSTESAARTKYLGSLGEIPPAKEIAVEDFVNYHRHDIGRPKAGEAVNLDVRWGGDTILPGGEAVLQVGMSTALQNDRQNLRPLNLSIVIDKSGSMADDNKLVRVKQALLTLVNELRPSDVLSIVVFDSEARVVWPAQRLTDKESVRQIIQEIEPGSATNLSGGLILGYQEALKHYDKEATNRVMLLTDGIANRGITDPREIAEKSASYNDRGIDLSTIGVGEDLNQDLLRKLAKSGRGLFHFVSDSEDIQKVFVKELQSLIAPVAQEPNLQISVDPGFHVEKVYGYSPKIQGNHISIKLDNMNSGMTEVVLVRCRATQDVEHGGRLAAEAQLSYYDLNRAKEAQVSQRVLIAGGERSSGMLEDATVAKNYTIAMLAQSIKDMAAQCETQRYREAQRTLDAAIGQAHETYPSLEDPDINRTLKIAERYQSVLRHRFGTDDSGDGERDAPLALRDTDRPRYAWHEASRAGILENGDFALGNCDFTTDIPYITPAENCLWGAYYTIAPRFDEPQLHTLVPNQAFAAPDRAPGAAQVFYANAGGTDLMKLLSMTAPCKQYTTYRVSFQAVSLSRGRGYIPTFEIRVNGARSEAQTAGFLDYKEVGFTWFSGSDKRAILNIMRLPIPHGGGLVGIANVRMVPVR